MGRETGYPPTSREGRAILRLARIAQYRPFILPNGNISFLGEVTPRILALADAPSTDNRYRIGSANFASWRALVKSAFKGCVFKRIVYVDAPWPWAPSAEGKTYSESSAQLSDEDAKALIGGI